MTSSSADCTFAGARLISSASRKLPNTGPSSVSKLPRVGAVDARADEVGGHEVGRELDAAEGAAEHVGERLDGQRLGQAGDALEQHVAAGQQRDQQALEHRVLADDDALDLVERLLEARARVLEDVGRVSRAPCGGASPDRAGSLPPTREGRRRSSAVVCGAFAPSDPLFVWPVTARSTPRSRLACRVR